MNIYKIGYIGGNKGRRMCVDKNKMTEDEFRAQIAQYPESGEQGMMSGFYRHMGWVYDLRDELKRFWVLSPLGDIREYYAKDLETVRTRLRSYHQSNEDNCESLGNNEIVEVPNPLYDGAEVR